MTPFAQLRLSRELESTDWVNSPAVFSEQLTRRIFGQRIRSMRFARRLSIMWRAWNRRLRRIHCPHIASAIAVIGRGVGDQQIPAVPKAAAAGHVLYPQSNMRTALRTLLEAVNRRAAAHPAPYGHWYIDGGAPELTTAPDVATVSYAALSPARAALQAGCRKHMRRRSSIPKPSASMLAQIKPRKSGSIQARTKCSIGFS